MRESKRFALKSVRKPRRHTALSSIVIVGEHTGKGYSYLNFSEEFVDAVGSALPFGVSESMPAYIKVLHLPGRDTWRVMAMYVGSEKGAILWETKERPRWLPDQIIYK